MDLFPAAATQPRQDRQRQQPEPIRLGEFDVHLPGRSMRARRPATSASQMTSASAGCSPAETGCPGLAGVTPKKVFSERSKKARTEFASAAKRGCVARNRSLWDANTAWPAASLKASCR